MENFKTLVDILIYPVATVTIIYLLSRIEDHLERISNSISDTEATDEPSPNE